MNGGLMVEGKTIYSVNHYIPSSLQDAIETEKFIYIIV